MCRLPFEILVQILNHVCIDLSLVSGRYILRRTEMHPLCQTLTDMIDTKWRIDDDFISAYSNDSTWDETEILRYYQRICPNGFVYKNCEVVRGYAYIRALCVKNDQIIYSSTQKYAMTHYGYMQNILGESIHLYKKEDQTPSVYYMLQQNEIDSEDKNEPHLHPQTQTSIVKYQVWYP